ncbi:hypothetical protein CFIO01_09157 [Colletotrichum fioriniae PJ7]|uniref:Uncharacterized protein n=1 Tax=Colletotrichum fioriniae PJ7 TaxID=1445577 RepID=A0A010RW67_9PEZI|nr:hypothetical protein CFIO01_09157 [Colletotrichum fioriniae PJ7]
MAPQDLEKCPKHRCGFRATPDCTLLQHINTNHGPAIQMPCRVYTIFSEHHFRKHKNSCGFCDNLIPAEEVPVPSVERDGSVDSEGIPEGEPQARAVHHGGIVVNGANNGTINQTFRCSSSACSGSPSN